MQMGLHAVFIIVIGKKQRLILGTLIPKGEILTNRSEILKNALTSDIVLSTVTLSTIAKFLRRITKGILKVNWYNASFLASNVLKYPFKQSIIMKCELIHLSKK